MHGLQAWFITRSLANGTPQREEPQCREYDAYLAECRSVQRERWRVWVELRYSAVKRPCPLPPPCPLSVLTWNQVHGLWDLAVFGAYVCSQPVSCFSDLAYL